MMEKSKAEVETMVTDFLKMIGEERYTVELRSKKSKSRDANSYLWVLCDKIAKEVKSTTREEVYRKAIKDVGVYDDLAVSEKATQRLLKGWNEKGIGWFSESFGESKVKGADKVRVYYGSSIYSNEEMSVLIDEVIFRAKELGIETLPPDEVERLKDLWGAKGGSGGEQTNDSEDNSGK